jgi:sugar transferase (PEP-CTERM/EpsH1 system associated)
MKILFLTPQMPYPPRQGAAIRNWHLLSRLAAHHEVSLLTFGSHPDVPEPVAAACRRVEVVPLPPRRLRDRLHTLLATPLPDLARRLWSPTLHARFQTMLAADSYDWVQVEGLEMAPYAQAGPVSGPRRPRPRRLLDEHNAEYVLQQRAFQTDISRPPTWISAVYSLVQTNRLRGYERAACQAADQVVAVSDADRAALLALDPGLSVAVVPNGVDLYEWRVGAAGQDADAARLRAVGPLVVFDGSMDFRPNVDAVVWFVHEVWPRVRAVAPLAQFAIVGRNPTRRVRALQAERGVVVTGTVPDTRPWVAAASVYVVPMRIGGGVRLKVLQALAMERALVSTTLGCEGVAVTHGVNVRLADDPVLFAQAVTELLQDEGSRHALGRAARHLAAEYAWEQITPRLEALLLDPPAPPALPPVEKTAMETSC